MESSKKREEHSSQFSLGFCGVGVAEMRCPDKISQFERLWCLHSLHSPACLGLLRPSQTVVLWLKETFSPLLLWKRAGGGAYCFIVTYFQGKTQNLSLEWTTWTRRINIRGVFYLASHTIKIVGPTERPI